MHNESILHNRCSRVADDSLGELFWGDWHLRRTDSHCIFFLPLFSSPPSFFSLFFLADCNNLAKLAIWTDLSYMSFLLSHRSRQSYKKDTVYWCRIIMSSRYYFPTFSIVSVKFFLYLNNTVKFLENTQSFLLPLYLLCFIIQASMYLETISHC